MMLHRSAGVLPVVLFAALSLPRPASALPASGDSAALSRAETVIAAETLARMPATSAVDGAPDRAGLEAVGTAPDQVARTAAPGDVTSPDALSAQQKVALTRVAGVGAILAWGIVQWDYGEQPLHANAEGWFRQDTAEGGADKLGHLYTGYVFSRAFGALYRHWGVEPGRAAAQAAATSLLITTTMEFGDGFSPYGISWEDQVMNIAGAWAGYALMRNETWCERLDLRMEYRPNAGTHDPTTDYEHARYFVALKLAGFAPLRDTPLQWLELHAGYYARGYDDPFDRNVRRTYVGVGLNLSRLARHAGFGRTATFLQFYQPPGLALRHEDEQG